MWTTAERAAARAAGVRDARLRSGARWRDRGVVHTPLEVARLVAGAADRALRAIAGAPGGLADPRVLLVDPACGPGAFLAAALAVAGRRATAPRLALGLDVDPEALAQARAGLGGPARRAGWPLELRCADTLASLAPFGAGLWPDAVAVVLGNPPWAGRSRNRGALEVEALLDDFRRDRDGLPLGERKIGVLSDDYVRFWRWSAEIARRAPGGGVVALVTNGSFLDGPVHRGMRAALHRWFDRIEVVDLGGSALVARDGGPDGNVFGVRPTVAVTVAARAPGPDRPRCSVFHRAVTGTRDAKLAALRARRAATAPIACAAPLFLLRPSGDVPAAWQRWRPLPALLPFHREGVQTNRDTIVVDADRHRLLERLHAFARGEQRPELLRVLTPSRHHDPERARQRLAGALAQDPTGERGVLLRRIAYRPFDDRWLCPVPRLCHRPRPELAAAVAHGGPILVTVRKDRGQRPWTHAGVTRHLPDNCWLSTRSSCRTRAFPAHAPDGSPNLSEEALEWAAPIGRPARADELLCYAAAVLSAPSYRGLFDAALRLDYPRLPPPPDRATFESIRDAGSAIARAFESTPGGAEVEVGHHRVASDALAHATQVADGVVSALLARVR